MPNTIWHMCAKIDQILRFGLVKMTKTLILSYCKTIMVLHAVAMATKSNIMKVLLNMKIYCTT